MKLTKAMKKLKFWSKKKKKKRVPLLDRPPSPPPPLLPCYYHCPYNYPVQPSAPPLPPWFEYVQPYDDSIFTTEQGSGSTADNSRQTHGSTNSQHIDNVGEINQPKPTPSDNTLPQQYMVQNQVYGVPVIAEARTEKGAGAFGCVINFGAHLFRCFFPCFHIRELK